jgi:hypothetical protein
MHIQLGQCTESLVPPIDTIYVRKMLAFIFAHYLIGSGEYIKTSTGAQDRGNNRVKIVGLCILAGRYSPNRPNRCPVEIFIGV